MHHNLGVLFHLYSFPKNAKQSFESKASPMLEYLAEMLVGCNGFCRTNSLTSVRMMSGAGVNRQGDVKVQKMYLGNVWCLISYGDENGPFAEIKTRGPRATARSPE